MSFKEQFISECLLFIKRKDVKDELKNIIRPFINLLLSELYPYVYLSLMFIIIAFLLILGIFILLLRYRIKSID